MIEATFKTWDGTPLFYRAWLPEQPARPASRALILFHRGHEHSGRFDDLVRRLELPDCAVFAWDARGHGRSPGERGWAPSFACLVRDAESFARYVAAEYAIPTENTAILAHSIGAVVAAAWVERYAPPIRAMVLAGPAFRVKLYIPFALAGLRCQLKFRKRPFVKSYVRPAMLTHDPAERAAYSQDPLISRSVAVNLLVEMHDISTRVIADAGAVRTPTLLLTPGADYVVKAAPQREFFRRLGSASKQMYEYPGFCHDILHERERSQPIAQAREFLLHAFEQPVAPDTSAHNQTEYRKLAKELAPVTPAGALWGAQRLFLKTVGRLSTGIRTGWSEGFDSGASLDYVYRNQAQGSTPVGRLIDGIYLNSPGWRGIRERRRNLEALLLQAIERVRAAGQPVRIFDPAAGGGRYVLETVNKAAAAPESIVLRDWSEANVAAAARLAQDLHMTGVTVAQGDAFDRRALAAVAPKPSIAIVSGLYELFPDNARVSESLGGVAEALGDDGYLIYTNQPWHPQLEMIARVLDNREGKPWVMRCRPQAEMDALVAAAGFTKLETLMDNDGIFTVSLARRRARGVGDEAGLLQSAGARP